MSKIKLTLTAEHYDAITAHETDWLDEGSEISLRDYFIIRPLTLEFEAPNPWRTDIENAPIKTLIIVETWDFTSFAYKERTVWKNTLGKTIHVRSIQRWMEYPESPQRS